MNEFEKYYYYDRENDCTIKCTWDEYIKVDSKVRDDNTIKCDKFSLGNGLKNYTISTICLMKDHRSMFDTSILPTIFETMVFTDDQNYDGYQKRYTSLQKAKEEHDEIVLKILRGEEID